MRRVVSIALSLVAFMLPMESEALISGVGSATWLLLAVAVFASAVDIFHRQGIRRPPIPLVLMFVIFLWALASIIWSIHKDGSVQKIWTYAGLFTLAALVWEYGDERYVRRYIKKAYVMGSVYPIGRILIDFTRGIRVTAIRYGTFNISPNNVAVMIVLAVLLALYLANRTKGLPKTFYFLVAASGLPAVLLTGSRTATISLLIGLVIYLWQRGDAAKNPRVHWMLPLSTLILAFSFVPRAILQRLLSTGTEMTGDWGSRLSLWAMGLDIFGNNPFGVGVGNAQIGVERLAGIKIALHNIFMTFLVELGIVGLGLILWFLLTVFIQIRSIPSKDEKGLWMAVFAVLLIGGSFLGGWETRKHFWLFTTLMSASKQPSLQRKEKASSA